MADSLAAFGRGYAYFAAIIVTIISAIVFLIGLLIYFEPKTSKDPNPQKTGIILMTTSLIFVITSWVTV